MRFGSGGERVRGAGREISQMQTDEGPVGEAGKGRRNGESDGWMDGWMVESLRGERGAKRRRKKSLGPPQGTDLLSQRLRHPDVK